MRMYARFPMGGKRVSVSRVISTGVLRVISTDKAEVREPGVGVIGHVIGARFVGAGDEMIEVELDIDETLLSERLRELLDARVF